jgi:hypothetical protein
MEHGPWRREEAASSADAAGARGWWRGGQPVLASRVASAGGGGRGVLQKERCEAAEGEGYGREMRGRRCVRNKIKRLDTGG